MAKQLAKVYGNINNYIEDVVDSAAPKLGDPNLLSNYKAAKLEYSDILQIQSALATTAGNSNAAAGLNRLAADMVSLKGITTASAISLSFADKGMIAPMSLAINALRRSKTAPATFGAFSNKIANFMEKYPKSPVSDTMLRRLTTSAAISSVEFEKELANQASRVSFLERPLERSVDEVKARRGQIFNLLKGTDEELAHTFQDLIENGSDDDIAMFMDNIGKDRDSKPLIVEGIGFNGRVYGQEDKDSLIRDVKANRNLPRIQRIYLQQKIQSEGYIPTPEDLGDMREPRPFIPRRKDLPEY